MKKTIPFMIAIGLFFTSIINCFATETTDYNAEAEERKNLPIESNETENWPTGPEIGAESAILIDANTGVILYAKNIDERLYPASTTKIMTCLLAVEHGNMSDMVSFSNEAVFSIDSGSSNIGIDVGQSLSLQQCLYGILVGSANEVANATAEYIGGSIDEFVQMMNDKAAELGCENTHFVNPHGLYDDNHYTTARDLSTIAKAFFQNELLCKIGNTATYHFSPTDTQPDDFTLRNKHSLINGDIMYDGIVGGKTGYTDEARQTLVTCAEKNGMKLICVILKEESPAQFTDTVQLFDYGFQNFQVVNVADNETKYTISNDRFFQSDSDIFGSSKPILSLNSDSYLVMPKTIAFTDLDSEISYDTTDDTQVALINYSYHGAYVGSASINLTSSAATYNFETSSSEEGNAPSEKTVVINMALVIGIIVGLAVLLIIIFTIWSVSKSYAFNEHKKQRRRRRRRKNNQFNSEYKDFKF